MEEIKSSFWLTLFISFKMKYRSDALAAAGRYVSRAVLICCSVTWASATLRSTSMAVRLFSSRLSTSSTFPRKFPSAADSCRSRPSSNLFRVILKSFCCFVRSDFSCSKSGRSVRTTAASNWSSSPLFVTVKLINLEVTLTLETQAKIWPKLFETAHVAPFKCVAILVVTQKTVRKNIRNLKVAMPWPGVLWGLLGRWAELCEGWSGVKRSHSRSFLERNYPQINSEHATTGEPSLVNLTELTQQTYAAWACISGR